MTAMGRFSAYDRDQGARVYARVLFCNCFFGLHIGRRCVIVNLNIGIGLYWVLCQRSLL